MDFQEYLKGMISDQKFSEVLHKQHYSFAHKIIPYIVENHFPELVSKILDQSVQSWILQLWNEYAEISIPEYTKAVYPTCNFIQPSDNVGLIYFVMPSPRVSPEVLYAAAIFFMDDDAPSEWLRGYFTLELGLSTSAYWTLCEWDDSNHINLGGFEYEPTLENFLKVVIAEAKKKWLEY
ncbi:MAG: hypothetical protein WA865_20005 [Spirulinaceae cyanobacterium]